MQMAGGQGPPVPGPTRTQAGLGRVVYLPEVKAVIGKPPASPMTSRYWQLPRNWQDLIESVRWAAGDNLSLEVKAPLTVTVELLGQKDTGALLLHMVNYKAGRDSSLKDIQVRIYGRIFEKVRRVSWRSPDCQEISTLPLSERNEQRSFTVPSLETYGLAIMT